MMEKIRAKRERKEFSFDRLWQRLWGLALLMAANGIGWNDFVNFVFRLSEDGKSDARQLIRLSDHGGRGLYQNVLSRKTR